LTLNKITPFPLPGNSTPAQRKQPSPWICREG
jgi:hypothetical protein